MYTVEDCNSPRDAYTQARNRARLEVFVNNLLHKDGWVATMEKALEPYSYEFIKKPYLAGYIRPQQVTGTLGIDRRCCFSKSFLPLPHFAMGDFGYKWMNVLRDVHKWLDYPIDCYEFMHRYYVKEGNKRVSVAKYLHFPGLKANVTRIIPLNAEREDVRCYHEFLIFERQTGMSSLWFSYEGAFTRLTALLKHHDITQHELLSVILPPYIRMTDNSLGPHDAVIDYLARYPGKGASMKSQTEALRRAVKTTRNTARKKVKKVK
ncbi:MAG: hypothetical protein ABR512_02810 [Desulfopila sp.]